MARLHPGIRRIAEKQYRIRATMTSATTAQRKEIDRVVECATMTDALRIRGELIAQLAAEDSGEQPARIKVRDYATRWFERRKPRLKYSTALHYANHVDHICDEIGEVYMDQLNPGHVNALMTRMAKTYAGWTCLGLLRLLRTMTRDAQAELNLPRWACERVGRPKPVAEYDDDNPNALTADELARLYEAMRLEPLFPLFACMAFTGLRFAEASALQWKDVDFDGGMLNIRRNQYRGVLGTPKTRGSRRRLPLVPELAEILRAHQMRLEASQRPGLRADWVFPSNVGTLLSTGVLKKPLERATAAAGIKTRITPHGLRRTLNTLALQVAPSETIRKVLGHSTAAMTAHYNAPDLDARRTMLGQVVQLVRTADDKRRAS